MIFNFILEVCVLNWQEVGLYLGLAAMLLGTVVALVKHFKPPAHNKEVENLEKKIESRLNTMSKDIDRLATRVDHVENKADTALTTIGEVKAMLKAHTETVREDFNQIRKEMHANHSQVINAILSVRSTGELG